MDEQNAEQQRENQRLIRQDYPTDLEYFEHPDISDEIEIDKCQACDSALQTGEIDNCEWCRLMLFSEGTLRVYPETNQIGRDDIKVEAKFGKEWINNIGKSPVQTIIFTHQGKTYRGNWFKGIRRLNFLVKIYRTK